MRVFLSSLAALVLFLGVGVVPWSEAHGPEESHGGAGYCTGFLVLRNGYAVMSGMNPMAEHGGRHGHEMEHGKMDMGGGTKKMEGHGMKDPLMGLKHGEHILTSKGVLCVPVAPGRGNTWMAAGTDKTLRVRVRSTKGALSQSSRDNEAFEILVMRHGKPVEGAQVMLISRMPHHDRMMPGGHGPSNDPDVEGLKAAPKGHGKYVVRTVDFSMAGSWLFEVEVKEGGKVSKAYFATKVAN